MSLEGNEVPCRDCFERQVGCHGKCKRYAKYKESMQKVNEERVKQLDYVGFKKSCYESKSHKNSAKSIFKCHKR